MYYIDSRMGAAGDMLLGAFIDLDIVDTGEVKAILENAGSAMGPTNIIINRIEEGTGLEISHDRFSHVPGREMQGYMEKGAEAIGLAAGKKLAMDILDTILMAEVKVHRSTMDDIHLHETGSPDTLVDILGIGFFYERLRLDSQMVHGSRISVGRGKVKIEHGIVDVPAPATAEILSTMEFEYGPHDGEMTTPTGAAILKNLLAGQTDEIPFEPTRIGCGLGTKSFDGNLGMLSILQSG
ncbi:MAG: DUF111 family protein [Thermoplasmata archaeon]|nr:DUF111 family protein [Thermoplasmata archaeon]